MGRGCQQQQVARFVFGQALQQFKSQLLTRATGGACMGLVHHHTLWRDGEKVLSMPLAFDVVQADNDDRVVVEQADTVWQVALDSAGAGGGECSGLDVETLEQLFLPLLHQVRRAQNRQAGDLAAVHQFAHDETGFDGLAYTHVVCDQQAHRAQPQRHQQRHQLVGARFHGNVAERTKWPAPCAQLQAQGIAQQQRRGVITGLLRVGLVECGRFYRAELEIGDERDDVVICAPQGPQSQQLGAIALPGVGLHHPLAPTGAHQVSRQVFSSRESHRVKASESVKGMGMLQEQRVPLAAGRHIDDGPALVRELGLHLGRQRFQRHQRSAGFVLSSDCRTAAEYRQLRRVRCLVSGGIKGFEPLIEKVGLDRRRGR